MATTISLKCDYCNIEFSRSIKDYNRNIKAKRTRKYCSRSCRSKSDSLLSSRMLTCKACEKSFRRKLSEVLKSKTHFCCQSCAATYNNKHKTYGTRRSKLEIYIESQIKSEFPSLEFIANGKSAIGSELDFYFPNLNLAIEINGIFHYKPVYGEEKLGKIQLNDKAKQRACSLLRIRLQIIKAIGRNDDKTNHGHWKQAYKIINDHLDIGPSG